MPMRPMAIRVSPTTVPLHLERAGRKSWKRSCRQAYTHRYMGKHIHTYMCMHTHRYMCMLTQMQIHGVCDGCLGS